MQLRVEFDNIDQELKKLLLEARESVFACVAWINGEVYGPIFRELVRRRVSVHLIYNHDYINRDLSEYLPAEVERIALVASKSSAHLMHHKFCVIDNEVVVTGSFNWSKRAPDHHENIVIIRGDFGAVARFRMEFEDLFEHHRYVQRERSSSHRRCSVQWSPLGFLCRHFAFNLGVVTSGEHVDEIDFSIWRICSSLRHVARMAGPIKERDPALSDHPAVEERAPSTKEEVLLQLTAQRELTERQTREYEHRLPEGLHALGYVEEDEQQARWGQGGCDRVIRIHWRHPSFRKVIPPYLHESESLAAQIICRPTWR